MTLLGSAVVLVVGWLLTGNLGAGMLAAVVVLLWAGWAERPGKGGQ